ncbi:hypothetical protein HanLR1_Chr00c0002g0688901 [Helianthus annuus]|nr:hypothetical protein HanLR1_Chr00c0002g0688901 [Helianthus annuus]
MFRIRNFEYNFRAVENFRRLYQLTVNTRFFSFNQRYGSTKLMTPPKGITKWKRRFFYVKAIAVYANMTLQDVNEAIPAEDIALPTAKMLWILRMMLSRPDRKARPVLLEKSGEDAALWRMFDTDYTGRFELLPCAEGEGFNLDIVGNFHVAKRDVLNAPLPQGKGNLGALAKFEAKATRKKHAEKKHVEKPVRGRGKKNLRLLLHLLWCRRRLGLGVPGGGAAAGGTSAGSKPTDERKRKLEKATDAGEKKRSRIPTKRTTAVS